MGPVIREIRAVKALCRTGIPGFRWCLNPYVGCAHACRYCYATFMRKYTSHLEEWGNFVDVRVNLPDLLGRELPRGRPAAVVLSSVTDPYQPVERRCRLTRSCLEALLEHGYPVSILTKSPLVLRDLDLLRGQPEVEVCISVGTDNEKIRRVFEPQAPPIPARLEALRALKAAGVRTHAFVGPLLPQNPQVLAAALATAVDRVYLDRMNYPSKTRHLYRALGMERWLEEGVVAAAADSLKEGLRSRGVMVD